MLVLSRRQDERILLPSLGVSIQVVSLRGNQVRLGIDAPPDVRIVRGELHSQSTQQPMEDQPPSCQPTIQVSESPRPYSVSRRRRRFEKVVRSIEQAQIEVKTDIKDSAEVSVRLCIEDGQAAGNQNPSFTVRDPRHHSRKLRSNGRHLPAIDPVVVPGTR